jgi:hypothetical protein
VLAPVDFAAVPMVSKAQMHALAAGDSWLAKGTNVLMFGPPRSSFKASSGCRERRDVSGNSMGEVEMRSPVVRMGCGRRSGTNRRRENGKTVPMNEKADKKRFERFKATARELGCDEDKERFEPQARANRDCTAATAESSARPQAYSS